MRVLGTLAIQNVSVTFPLPGQIRVTGHFVDGFTATGVILIIYSLNNNSNVHYIDKDKEQRSVSVTIMASHLISSLFGSTTPSSDLVSRCLM